MQQCYCLSQQSISSPALTHSRPLPPRTSSSSIVAPVAPRFAAVKAVRMYSAAAGLKQDEVEGRIMGLLTGFDKVSHPSRPFRHRRFVSRPRARRLMSTICISIEGMGYCTGRRIIHVDCTCDGFMRQLARSRW